ncbi:Ig domain-containing protein [Myxococcota bacterium]|nr:Ig domain-containing protein [Myxococcota bacterium]
MCSNSRVRGPRIFVPILIAAAIFAVFASCSSETEPLAASVPRITTTSLPDARVGAPYAATLSAESGVEPYRFSLLLPTLPAGLVLDGTGRIAGTPTEPGRYAIAVQVEDAVGTVNDTLLDLFVAPPPPPPGPATCTSPRVLDLSTGQATAEVVFGGELDRERTTCGDFGLHEAVFAFELGEARDLTIRARVDWAAIELRPEDCARGIALACSEEGELTYLPNVPAGGYHLVVEGADREGRGPSTIEVTASDPTLPPANERCASATPLAWSEDRATVSFSSGAARASGSELACDDAPTLFYAFDLDRPSIVDLTVETDDTAPGVEVGLVRGTCTEGQVVDCERDRICTAEALPAGSYLVAVTTGRGHGPRPSGSFTIARTDPPARPANDTCAAATPVVLDADGRAELEGTVEGAVPTETVASLCFGFGDAAVAHFALDLAARSDVTVAFPSAQSGSSRRAVLLGEDCMTPLAGGCAHTTDAPTFYGVPAGRVILAVAQTDASVPAACLEPWQTPLEVSAIVRAVPSPPSPTNDTCASAELVTLPGVGASVPVLGTTRGASDDAPFSSCGGVQGSPEAEVFYRVELAVPGRLRVTQNDRAAVYMSLLGPECSALTPLFCAPFSDVLDTQGVLPAGPYHLRVENRTLFGQSTPVDFVLTFDLL